MTRAPRRQAGRSLLSNLFWLLVMGFFLLLGIRLFPVFYDYLAIKASMDEVAAREDTPDKSRDQLWDTLYKHFYVNGIDYLEDKDFHLRRTPEGTQMVLDYDVRRPFIGNVDLVVHFRHTTPLR